MFIIICCCGHRPWGVGALDTDGAAADAGRAGRGCSAGAADVWREWIAPMSPACGGGGLEGTWTSACPASRASC